jgi:uncharacterized protein (TIGR02453 family)
MPEGDEMTFTGFTAEVRGFFDDLAQNNHREWFTAHRADYERLIREPLEDLLAEAQATWGPGRVMRPNRDVRFSQNKAPYRTSAAMWAGEVGAVYVSVSAKGIDAGGGLYEPSRDQLDQARVSIDRAPASARQLAEIIADLQARGFAIPGPSLTTAPRGYPRDHPHIELLRLRHYAATRPLPLTTAPADIMATWEAVTPLIDWTAQHAGPRTRPS